MCPFTGTANTWTRPITKVCRPSAITIGSSRLWRNGWIWPSWKSFNARRERSNRARYAKAKRSSNTRRPATSWSRLCVTWVKTKKQNKKYRRLLSSMTRNINRFCRVCFHVCVTLAQMKEFWKHLAWPDLIQSYNFVLKLLDVIWILSRANLKLVIVRETKSERRRLSTVLWRGLLRIFIIFF